ncbi:hypothetical protein D8X55_05030, partial [Malacoplasma penetrans]
NYYLSNFEILKKTNLPVKWKKLGEITQIISPKTKENAKNLCALFNWCLYLVLILVIFGI